MMAGLKTINVQNKININGNEFSSKKKKKKKKKKNMEKKIVNWVTLYLAWLLKPLKWYKKGKMIIEKNTYVLETC